MRLPEVQPMAAAQIAAAPALAAFGAALVFNIAADPDTMRAAINTRLSSAGVVIEVGSVDAQTEDASPSRFNVLKAGFDLFVAENPKHAHSPAGLDLVQAVILAMSQKINDPGETAPVCTGYDNARSEQGYVLHVISFTYPVRVP